VGVPGEGKWFHFLNRGKRSIVLDLQQERAQQAIHRIVPRFDVVLINTRPGVPQRLHIDYETLRRFRPDLIYWENTGFGSRGPSANRSGSDIVAQAYSGLMASEGKVGQSGAPELIASAPFGDLASGLSGAMGVCAALYWRSLTGKGQLLRSSLLASALSLQGYTVGRMSSEDIARREPMMQRVRELREAGASFEEVLRARTEMLRIGTAWYTTYLVKDGAITLGALTPANADQMRRVLGIEDDPSADPSFNALDPANREALANVRKRVEQIMLTRTMAEWVEAFDAEGAPCAPVHLPEELADDPQVEALGLMVDLDHPLTGPERMVGAIVEMSETPTGAHYPSPPLGRDTEEVLRECGLADEEIAALFR
jgi:formyl-CoA transferase